MRPPGGAFCVRRLQWDFHPSCPCNHCHWPIIWVVRVTLCSHNWLWPAVTGEVVGRLSEWFYKIWVQICWFLKKRSKPLKDPIDTTDAQKGNQPVTSRLEPGAMLNEVTPSISQVLWGGEDYVKKTKQNKTEGVGETAHQLQSRVGTASAEDCSSVLSTHKERLITACNHSSWGPQWTPRVPTCTCLHHTDTNTYISKNKINL